LKPCREQRTPGPNPSFPLPALVLTGVSGATMATVAEGARLARWDSWHFVAIWGCRGLPGATGGYRGLLGTVAPERYAVSPWCSRRNLFEVLVLEVPCAAEPMGHARDGSAIRGPDLSVLGRQAPLEIPRPDEKRPEAFMASGPLISRVMPDWHQAIWSCCGASRGSQPFEARRRTATTPNTEARPARLAATEVGSGTVIVTSALFTMLSDAPE
jgi:hypothetical protein